MKADISSARSPTLHQGDHRLGDPASAVVLVEFGDYECALSGHAQDVVEELQRRLRSQLCYVFRHFPRTDVHPHAFLAAEAAEAAGAQGRFWRMHELLFENQDSLYVEALAELGRIAGADETRLIEDLRTHRFAERVHDDLRSGLAIGVARTPTFFAGGARYDAVADFDSLWLALDGHGGASVTMSR